MISGTISYDASPASPYLVVVRVEDPGGLSASDSFAWTVADTNRPPEVTDPGPQGAGEGQAVTLASSASTPTGTVSPGRPWACRRAWPSTRCSGVVSGTVTFDASPASPYWVTVRATDDGTPLRWAEVSFSWTVADTNRSPVVSLSGRPGRRRGPAGDLRRGGLPIPTGTR